MDRKAFDERVDEYLNLLGDIKSKTNDERTALTLLQEVKKDMRAEQIRRERANEHTVEVNGEIPATEKQIGFLERLGVAIREALTKFEASKLIDEAKESQEDSVVYKIATPGRWYSGMIQPRIP